MKNCPKRGGMLIADYSKFGMDGNKCVACGCYHEVGASRQSLDRQVTGVEPKGYEYAA